tara:strand:- start:5942 stop:6688 length:747 start_codon:yes stop_codon:yes gene_type:complete
MEVLMNDIKYVQVPENSILPSLPPMPPEIANALNEVSSGAVKLYKGNRNEFANYNFAGIDDFLEVYGKVLAEAGLTIMMDEIDEKVDNKSLIIVFNFILVHKSGKMWAHPLRRTIRVDPRGAQAYGTAQSYALKQFLRGLFMIPTGEDKDMVASPDADGLPAHNFDDTLKFQSNSKKNTNLKVVGGQENGGSEVEKVNNFLSELRKLKSNDDIDKLVKDNVNFVNGLSERFRKDVENNVRAWRKTVDG